MVTSGYIISGRNIEGKVAEFVRNFYLSAYESKYNGGYLRVFEDAKDLVVIRVDNSEAERGKIRIEVISGGGEEKVLIKSAFSSIFNKDQKRIRSFAKELEVFCERELINYEPE
jgi:hypothetical protein